MELKKIYKIMSISMLLIVVGQVTYPLFSEVTAHATDVTSQVFDAAMSSNDSFKDTKEGITEYDASSEGLEETNNLENNIINTKPNEVSPSETNNELVLNEVISDENKEVNENIDNNISENINGDIIINKESGEENVTNSLNQEEKDRINSMDSNNLSQEDIEFLVTIIPRVVDENIVEQYISSLRYQTFHSNDSWTPGDPLPGSDDDLFSTNLIASGSQYYQGQEFPEYGNGKYYVYYDQNNPGEATPYVDVVGSPVGDVGPNNVGGIVGKGDLCPYIKEESANLPNNVRRGECDYVDATTNPLFTGGTIDLTSHLDFLPSIFQSNLNTTGEIVTTPYSIRLARATTPDGTLPISNGVFDQYGDYDVVYYPEVNYSSINMTLAPKSTTPSLALWLYFLYGSDMDPTLGNDGAAWGTCSSGLPTSCVITSATTGAISLDWLEEDHFTIEVVDDKQLLAANDIVVAEAFAPRSDAQVLSMSNAHFIEPEDFIDRYGENHAGDVYSVEDVNYVIDTGDYDYNNPTSGTHMVEITAISPTTGFEVSRVITIEVTNYYEGENESGILLANTPVVIDNNEGSYEALMKAEPITIIYKNGVLDHVEDETADENFFNLSIVQSDLKETSSDGRTFYRIATNHDGIFYEDVIEVQQTWNGEPITDTITIDAIDNLTIQDNYKFDPLVTTNAHAYNSDGDKEDINVRTSGAYASTETNGQKVHQVVLEASNDEAYGVKLVNMDVVDVEDGEMPLIAAKDANVRSSFTPDNAQDILDLMSVKAVDVDGTDITDLVQVFDTDGFEYGDGKLTGNPYQITLGVTSPLTGITVTTSKDLSVIGNSEVVPSVELAGNNPIYVKLGDGTTAEDITAMIAPDVLVYENKEFADAIDDSISLLNDDAYDNDTVGSYYFLYDGIYNEEKSDIDPISAENIYEVKVTDQIDKTQVPLSIDAPEDTKLVVGDDFNALKGVTATSTTDGDVTANIEVLQNEVDTTEAGDYDVTYHVSDSTGQESYKNVTVSVYDSEEDLNDAKDKEEKETSASNNDSSNVSESANVSSEELTDTATTSIFRLVFTMVLALGAATIVIRIKYSK